MAGNPMPSRGNLVAECVRVMKLRIDAGEWRGLLPGERRLAETLQVGRDTVRLALRELERERVLAPADAGSRRRILAAETGAGKPGKARPLRIGMLSSHRLERLPQPMLVEVDHIRGALADKGGSLELFAPGWYDLANPVKRLEALVAEERCAAWILFRSSRAVQTWFEEAGVPCLIRGYPHPGIRLPHLDVDWHATARHAAGMLWRLGHRRVGVLVPAERLHGVTAAVHGVMDLGEDDFRPFEMVENGTVEGVVRALGRALQLKDPPTAIIATRPRQAATALTWLAARGIQVPARMSLITLAREPFLEHLVPAMTGYHIDPAAVAKLVVRRLQRIVEGGGGGVVTSWISPDWDKGASVSKPG